MDGRGSSGLGRPGGVRDVLWVLRSYLGMRRMEGMTAHAYHGVFDAFILDQSSID